MRGWLLFLLWVCRVVRENSRGDGLGGVGV